MRWPTAVRHAVTTRRLAVLAVIVIIVAGVFLTRALAADRGRPPLGPVVVVTPHPPGSSRPVEPSRPPDDEDGARTVPRRGAPCAGENDPDDEPCD